MTPTSSIILQFRMSQHRGMSTSGSRRGRSGTLRAAAGGGLLEPDEAAPLLNLRRPLTITSGDTVPGLDLDDQLLPPLGMTM